MTASSKPASPGPQTGAPPSLEFVALDRLEVDPAYQRLTDGKASRRLIAGMVACWKWQLCQPLVVGRREDGRLMVIDGQHRLAGARERGDIAHLPCVIMPGTDREGEAGAFVEINTCRQSLSQADIFAGMLAAGDADAHAVLALLEETGWSIVRHNSTNTWKPGELHCAPMLARALKKSGADALRAALAVLRAAWPDQPVTCSSQLIQALLVLFTPAVPDERARGVYARALGSSPSAAWLIAAEELRGRSFGLARGAALVRVIVNAAGREAGPLTETAGGGRHAGSASPAGPPAPAPLKRAPRDPAPARAPEPSSPAFGVAGKGWCDQCEQLVTRDRAAACRSSFCKMRLAA